MAQSYNKADMGMGRAARQDGNQHLRFSEVTKSTNGIQKTMWDDYDTNYGHGRLSAWDLSNINSKYLGHT